MGGKLTQPRLIRRVFYRWSKLWARAASLSGWRPAWKTPASPRNISTVQSSLLPNVSDRALYQRAAEDLRRNKGQWDAYNSEGNCVVLAGPGSGKTKTL